MISEPDRCDLVVWDVHGDLTSAVRRSMRGVVSRRARKIESVSGAWRDHRIAVARPRRLTAAQQPTIREVLVGLMAVHYPRVLAIVGPAAPGDSNVEPGSVVRLAEARGVLTHWSSAAQAASDDLGAEAILLAAVTVKGATAPRATRVTAGRQAGRWLGALFRGAVQPPDPLRDAVAVATAEALAELVDEPG